MAVAKTAVEFDEYEMFTEYRRTGDKQLRDEIFNVYLYIAEILSCKFINRGIEYEDIYQVACMGILYAVERFDPEKGIKFATYATPTVLGEIRRYFRDKGNFIKIPRRLYEIFYKAEKIKRSTANSASPMDEVARILDLPEETVREAYEFGDLSFIRSLENEAYADGNMSLANVLGRDDDRFIMIENRDFIAYCLNQLTDQETDLVKKRYYDERSQKDIADEWHVSQMYISRFEKKVLKKLRDLYFRD